MRYIAIYTTTNADGKRAITRQIIDANDMKTAHVIADTNKPHESTVRVYNATTDEQGGILTPGVVAGALTVVKRTTANAIKREGNPLQYKLYSQVRIAHPEQFPDVGDMIGEAIVALLDSIHKGDTIEEQYHNAYKKLNNYLYSMRAIRIDERPAHIYFEDIDGEIVNVNQGINKIISRNERYIPEPDNDNDTRIKQRKIIKAVLATLTPTQITVLALIAKGYTQRQVAEKLNRSVSTINGHLKLIRKKAFALYPNGNK